MGDTISTLVFRPPPPTYLKPTRYFFVDIEPEDKRSLVCSDELNCTNSSSADEEWTGKHRIPAFFIKRKGAVLTLLFSHGNAEDLGMMYNRMRELARVLQVNIMAYDYTGYGFSTGSPSEEMCYRNIEAAYAYLRNVRRIPPSQIVLYGRSLGSGPSCHLAAKTASEGQSVAALILHSPFLSVYRVVMDCGFNMVGDMFLNISNAKSIRCPALIIHGTKDEVVPFWHGQELLQTFPPQCRAKPFWAEGLGHNNIEVYLRKIYIARVTGFMDRYVPARRGLPSQDADREGHQPLPVPESERAGEIEETIPKNKFFVNQTWVKYGKQIVDEAVNSKKRVLEMKKTQEQRDEGSQHKGSSLGTEIRPTISSMPQMQLQVQMPQPDPVLAIALKSPAHHLADDPPPIFTTRTCDMVLPDDPEEEDREDENTNSINQQKRDDPDEKPMSSSKIVKRVQMKSSGQVKFTQVTGIKRLSSKKRSQKR